MAVADTAKLIASLELKDKFSGPANKVTGSLGKMEKGFGRVGKGFGQVSAGATRAGLLIGGAVVTGLGAATKAAIDWEDAFTGVVKTVDAADLSRAGLTFDDLAAGLRKMSTEMPNTAVELAGIAESAGALGIRAKDILAFTKQVAILASTTDVSAEDAAMALGQLQNVIGLTGDEFDNFAASLVDLGNKGSSTEGQILEIARRAGGAAKLFGIAKDETLGWAAAAANLGLNQELAGTALQNTFIKLLPQINKGSKTLTEVMGQSAKDIKRAFKRDAGGALEDLLRSLGKMPKDARLAAVTKLFGKGSGLTRLILGLSESVDTNLTPSLNTSTKAWKDATAAQVEFDKRNATVRSAIERFKNTAIDAAVSVGEGIAPAIGRAADQLGAFLRQDENRNQLKEIGKDIGASIDGIDWKEVISGAKDFVGIMKDALGWAKRIFDIFNALPTEIKGSLAGLLAVNKLSGGLVGAGLGNIIGGLGETVARGIGSQLPGVGKLFAQPVFVTNWPIGGLAGAGAGGAAATGLSAVSKVFLVGEAIGLAIAVNEVRNGISQASSAQATAISTQTQQFIASQPSKAALENSLAGVNKGIHDLEANPLNVLVQGSALEQLRAMAANLKAAIADRGPNGRDSTTQAETTKGNVFGAKGLSESITDAQRAAAERITTEVEAMKGRIADELGTNKTAIDNTKSQVSSSGNVVAGATRSGASSVVGAIRANRPIINVDVDVSATTVQKSEVVNVRYGPAGGDRDWTDIGKGGAG